MKEGRHCDRSNVNQPVGLAYNIVFLSPILGESLRVNVVSETLFTKYNIKRIVYIEKVSQMGDYDYGNYAQHRTGVAPFGNGPFYNSLPLWSYKPTMTSSPPSSVIMPSSFAVPRRQAMSEVGTTREVGLHRSDTVMTARSMPAQEYDDNHSVAWYQKTKQALSAIPAMFEARVNKGNTRDHNRYNGWQPPDIDSNPNAQFLSLPAKPVSFFQANVHSSHPTSASEPDQSAFSKPHSVDGLNQRYSPSAHVFTAPAFSEFPTSAKYSPSVPNSSTAFPESPNSVRYNLSAPASSKAFSESLTSAQYNPSVPASSKAFSKSPTSARYVPSVPASSPPFSESPTSDRYKLSAPVSSAAAFSARYNPAAEGPSVDDRTANGQAASSRVFLKGSPTSKHTAEASNNYATPRFTSELPPSAGANVEARMPTIDSSYHLPVADPSLAPGLYSKHTSAQSRPSESVLGHKPHVNSSSVELPPASSYPILSNESTSKDYVSEPSGQIKYNPLFESHIKNRGPSDLSAAFATSSRTEVGSNRHPSGPLDGVRGGNRLAARVSEKAAAAHDEKQIVKDAFQFLDDFDE